MLLLWSWQTWMQTEVENVTRDGMERIKRRPAPHGEGMVTQLAESLTNPLTTSTLTQSACSAAPRSTSRASAALV
jgi:hypothetical protein